MTSHITSSSAISVTLKPPNRSLSPLLVKGAADTERNTRERAEMALDKKIAAKKPIDEAACRMEAEILNRVSAMTLSSLQSPPPASKVSISVDDLPTTSWEARNVSAAASTATWPRPSASKQGTSPPRKRKLRPQGPSAPSTTLPLTPGGPPPTPVSHDSSTAPRTSNAIPGAGGPRKKRRSLLATAPLFPLCIQEQEDSNGRPLYCSPFDTYEHRIQRLAALHQRPSRLNVSCVDDNHVFSAMIPSATSPTSSTNAGPVMRSSNIHAPSSADTTLESPALFGPIVNAGEVPTHTAMEPTVSGASLSFTVPSWNAAHTPIPSYRRRRRQVLKMRRSGHAKLNTTTPAPLLPCLTSPPNSGETPLESLARNMSSSSSPFSPMLLPNVL